MILANQIAGFLKTLYVENETVSQLGFWYGEEHLGKKLGDWIFFLKILTRNALSQSDYRILKRAISWERKGQLAWFSACRCTFRKESRWLKFFLEILKRNALSQSDCRIPKTAISWERNSQVAWFFACI